MNKEEKFNNLTKLNNTFDSLTATNLKNKETIKGLNTTMQDLGLVDMDRAQ